MAEERQEKKLQVFISYSRVDESFADELKLGLEDKGYSVSLDKHSIRTGEEWKARLAKLIADCDTVVFVLSPDSARSPVCHWEVEEAYDRAKRIVPVLYRGLDEPPKGTQSDGSPWPAGVAKAPERLGLLNYPRFDEGRSFMWGLRGVEQALEDDLDWIEAHSRLAARARDWQEGGRPTNRLMSGPDIVAAKRLVETRKSTAPAMLPLQLDYLQASEVQEATQTSAREKELEERRRLAEAALAQSQQLVRRTKLGLLALAAFALLTAIVGLWAEVSRRDTLLAQAREEQARTQAEQARTVAEKAQAIAERRADRLRLSMLEAMTGPTAVQQAIDFMIAQEIGAGYDSSKTMKPIWPRGNSGVTIGIGYDLGYVTEQALDADWGSALPEKTMTRLKLAIGKHGSEAQAVVETLNDIEVPFVTARQVFVETAIPKYYGVMTRTFPGAVELPFACQAALLSLVYNRGGTVAGERARNARDQGCH